MKNNTSSSENYLLDVSGILPGFLIGFQDNEIPFDNKDVVFFYRKTKSCCKASTIDVIRKIHAVQ